MNVYGIAPYQPHMAAHSSMQPLMAHVNGRLIQYECMWRVLQARSWTLGYLLKKAGEWYSGSGLNRTIPVWDELKFLRAIEPPGPSVAHFLLGEAVTLKWPRLFHMKGAGLVGTFHASLWRQARELSKYRGFHAYDWITVVSRSMIPFFVERGFPAQRLRVILHGVDTVFFRPSDRRPDGDSRALKALLVGKTERDHEFMARVMRSLPANTIELSVVTLDEQKIHYRDASAVRLLGRVSDEELLALYQASDLLIMPMIDCTANNAILESMACGTPVMVNRVGGIPEYVSEDSSYILDGKRVDEWVDLLVRLSRDRQELRDCRPAVRQWAESFDWSKKADEYREVYAEAIKMLR